MYKNLQDITVGVVHEESIESPELFSLSHLLAEFCGEVRVAGPTKPHKGGSVSISIYTPLFFSEQERWSEAPNIKAWKVRGTPTDCARVVTLFCDKEKPADMLFSGFGVGRHTGRFAFMRGFIGPVLEGASHGIPSVAISLEDPTCDYELLKPYLRALVSYILKNPPPLHTFFNVNIPKNVENIQGMRFAFQGENTWQVHTKRLENFSLKDAFWHEHHSVASDEVENCENYLLNRDFISVTPLSINQLEDEEYFERHKDFKIQPMQALQSL